MIEDKRNRNLNLKNLSLGYTWTLAFRHIYQVVVTAGECRLTH